MMRGSFRTIAGLIGVVFLLVFVGSCDVSPNSPSSNSTTTTMAPTTTTTSTTTTTTGGTTTTTTGGTTTTTTSTTTTAGLTSYATQVHPIWDAEDCTNCHSGGTEPNLSGTPTETCASLAARDMSNPNLIITGGGEEGSEILEKPGGRVSHGGGSFSCFGGAGQACYDTVLLWLQQGANGPSGTCGG